MKTSLFLTVLVLGTWTSTHAQSPALQQYLLLSDTIIGYKVDEFRARLRLNTMIQKNQVRSCIPVSDNRLYYRESLMAARPVITFRPWGVHSYSPRFKNVDGYGSSASRVQRGLAQTVKVADFIMTNFH